MDTSRENIADRGEANGGGGREPRRLDNDKLCYTVPEAAQLLGISRNHGYELAKRGEIPTVCFGKRKLVPKVPFHKMLGDYPESEVNRQ